MQLLHFFSRWLAVGAVENFSILWGYNCWVRTIEKSCARFSFPWTFRRLFHKRFSGRSAIGCCTTKCLFKSYHWRRRNVRPIHFLSLTGGLTTCTLTYVCWSCFSSSSHAFTRKVVNNVAGLVGWLARLGGLRAQGFCVGLGSPAAVVVCSSSL